MARQLVCIKVEVFHLHIICSIWSYFSSLYHSLHGTVSQRNHSVSVFSIDVRAWLKMPLVAEVGWMVLEYSLVHCHCLGTTTSFSKF